ncbi:MAG: hypothetical protein H0X51_00005 [Parachlamydiaceae bacterium]|nr:hypothetical protein [Parachlamydiaceae bacterium]
MATHLIPFIFSLITLVTFSSAGAHDIITEVRQLENAVEITTFRQCHEGFLHHSVEYTADARDIWFLQFIQFKDPDYALFDSFWTFRFTDEAATEAATWRIGQHLEFLIDTPWEQPHIPQLLDGKVKNNTLDSALPAKLIGAKVLSFDGCTGNGLWPKGTLSP